MNIFIIISIALVVALVITHAGKVSLRRDCNALLDELQEVHDRLTKLSQKPKEV